MFLVGRIENKNILGQIFMVGCTLFICISCSSPNHTENQTLPNKDQLLEAINTFNTAFKNGDVARLESMITDNYQHTNGTSKSIGKESWLNYLHKRKQDLEAGNLVVNAYEMDQMEVELYEDMAIVTARVNTKSTLDGETRENEFRVTNVWVLEDGKWKRAGFHDGKIK